MRRGERGYLIPMFDGGPRSLFGAKLSKPFIYGSRRFDRRNGRGGSRGVDEVLVSFLRHMYFFVCVRVGLQEDTCGGGISWK